MLTQVILAGSIVATAVLAVPGFSQQQAVENTSSNSRQETRYLVYMRGIT